MRFLILVSLFLAACAAGPESTSGGPPELTFVHLNDTYRPGAVEDGERGGFGRVVTVIRQLQRDGRDLRITHGGDFLSPSLESDLWKGLQMVEAMNYLDALAPMYVVTGNHEFDSRDPQDLAAAVRASEFDWLGDNYRFVTGEADVDAALRGAFTYEHAGRTVGVFSLTLHPDDGGTERDYLAVDRDYVGRANEAIVALEARGADIIIGVTHLHLRTDLEIAKLKGKHPQFGFIVGGHEHEPQHSPPTAAAAAVYKGASNARVIWRIDVNFDADGLPVVAGERLAMDTAVSEDPGYQAIPRRYREQLLDVYPMLEARVARAALPMDATEESIRGGENSWANFIVDQMRRAFGEPAADLAFINSGTLRIDDYVAGDILYEDIARTFAFSSLLRRLPISGAEFRALMETGFRGDGTSQGYFPQVSGFRLCVDRSRPEGDRIVSLQLPEAGGWREIDADREYVLVMPEFLFDGGDGYRVPAARKAAASPPGSELKYLVLDALIDAQAQGRAVGKPVDPTNPRIEVQAGPARRCFAQSDGG